MEDRSKIKDLDTLPKDGKILNKHLINGLIVTVIVAAVVAIIGLFALNINNEVVQEKSGSKESQTQDTSTHSEYDFQAAGLETNTAVSSIDKSLILQGCSVRDCIPAISNPTFTSTAGVSSNIKDETLGILVESEGEHKFYPYNIMAWHEIVNDTVGSRKLTITFCPLCGSAIVFDPTVNGETLTFGVSGKLYESNLLMYDSATQSLWSQTLGEAVVGDKTGTKLTVYPSQLIEFQDVKRKFPKTLVMTEDTGHSRDYSVYPYGGYETSETTIFPVSFTDKRLPAKEIMYVFYFENKSIAAKISDLRDVGQIEIPVGDSSVSVKYTDAEYFASDSEGNIIPGYFEMWFSWAVQHQDDGIPWTSEGI